MVKVCINRQMIQADFAFIENKGTIKKKREAERLL